MEDGCNSWIQQNHEKEGGAMTKPITTFVTKTFFLSLTLTLAALYLLHHHYHRRPPNPLHLHPDIAIRPGYPSYDAYLQRQLNKTLNPRLRRIWTTRDWHRKVSVFASFFRRLRYDGLLSNRSRALCVGARVGQEVAALRLIGVADAVGIDLVPAPPLVVAGDFHRQPFPDGTFDFEFSNVFDHALYPDRFVGEIERTLKPGGVCVLHLAVKRPGDKYSANDLRSIRPVVALFAASDLLHVRPVDGFGLDTEVAFRRRRSSNGANS